MSSIDRIYCYIDFVQNSSCALYDREKIHEILSKEASRYFKKYGLKYKIEPLAGLGGGGLLSIFGEGLMIAWQNRDLIGIFVSSFKILINTISFIKANIKSKLTNENTPTIYINLSLKTDEIYSNQELDYVTNFLKDRLVNLKYISDDLCKSLANVYSVFNYDQSFSLSVYSRSYWVSYYLPSNQKNTLNSYRLINLFKSLQIEDNFYSYYKFTKWLLISREDGYLQNDEKSRMRETRNTYYLFSSTKVLRDYYFKISKLLIK